MGFPKNYPLYGTVFLSLSLTLSAGSSIAGQHSVSTEVQQNITLLQETKNCPKCDLSGAVLNRMDLSGADLQGANLSRAKMFLTDLSGANLQNSDLREAQFGGADLANADLRGSDLTGTSLAGAYIGGALFDGEMVTTMPYKNDNIADVEEIVYVDDTVKPKSPQKTEDLTIASRRDFEETPPSVPVKTVSSEATVAGTISTSMETGAATETETVEVVVREQGAVSPPSKAVPVIQEVRIQDSEEAPRVLLSDNTKKQLTRDDTSQSMANEESTVVEPAQEQIEETVTVVQTVNTEKTDEAVVEVQTDSLEDQPEIPNENDTVVAVQGKDEAEIIDSKESTEESQVVTPEVTSTEVIVTQLPEETAQIQEAVNELEESVSVHGPGSELLQNIELLLDSNQCYGCNLAGADLQGENLEEADLEGADLSNALLQNADLEGANLKGANLSGANLTDADLSEADCYKAVLIDADLTNANLENTLLDDADLSGVKGYQKTILMMPGN